MYQFILNMWIMKKVTVEKINQYVTKGRITEDEAKIIIGTPQIGEQIETP